jgi:hypothetical protein
MSLLGTRVDKQPNLQVTFADHSPGNPRAACFPVSPPHDVRVTFSGAAQLMIWRLALRRRPCSATCVVFSEPLRTGILSLFIRQIRQPTQATATCLAFCCWILNGYRSSYRRLVRLKRASWFVMWPRPGSKSAPPAAETLYAMPLHSAVEPSLEQMQGAFVDLHDSATGFHIRPELFLLDLHERISSAGQLRALAFLLVCANTCACAMGIVGGLRERRATS